jgi:pimeloyl-ACP methyl ester carboxylesterase
MSTAGSNTTAPTRFVQANSQRSAYRRFGNGPGRPLLCLQHFTGTLDNWDPAVTDPLATGREVLLFEMRASDAQRGCPRDRGRNGGTGHRLPGGDLRE